MELIVAHAEDGVIGKQGQLPWDLKEDMKFFANTTKDSVIIMGRKTYLSLPDGGLKGRVNIVLTHNTIDGVICATMDNLMEIVEKYRGKRKIFVIGGSMIYDLLLNKCDVLHITKINLKIDGADTFLTFDAENLVKDNIFRLEEKSEILISKVDSIEYQFFRYRRIL